MNHSLFYRHRLTRILVTVGVYLAGTTVLCAESPDEQPIAETPTASIAGTRQPTTPIAKAVTDGDATLQDGQAVSLQYALDFTRDAYDRINQDVLDYTCLMINRVRVDGKLRGYRGMLAKVRHERKNGDGSVVPFGVYLRFLKPSSMEGREVLYVPVLHQGDLIVRRGGLKSPNITLWLQPEGALAMEGNRYPVTEIGLQTLTRRLIQLLEAEQPHQDAAIEVFPDAKVDDRSSTSFRLTYHRNRPGTTFRTAEVAFDKETSIPVYFRSWGWPTVAEEKPVLDEYYFKRVQLNVGLTDWDFDVHNPEYQFKPN